MYKALSRNLFFLVIALYVVAVVVPTLAGATLDSAGTLQGGSATLDAISPFIRFAASLIGLAASIGALIRVAQLQRWGWFVGILLTFGIGFLLYIFIGPTTPRNASA